MGPTIRHLPYAIVADLGSLSAAFGRDIHMLIGTDMFVDKSVAIDFGGRRFALAPTGSFKAGKDWTRVDLYRGDKQELYIRASINDQQPIPLMIDLGSSAGLMLSSTYAGAQEFTKNRRTSTAALGGVDGVSIVDVFMTPHIGIGNLEVKDVPSLGHRSWLSKSTVGNIGLPLIGQFDTVFDVTAGFVWFRPTRVERRLIMLKDRVGLGVAASRDFLTVVHVAAGSPAAKAGWKVGERIKSVNGHAIDRNYTHDSLWKWRFGPAHTTVCLEVGDGAVRILTLNDYY